MNVPEHKCPDCENSLTWDEREWAWWCAACQIWLVKFLDRWFSYDAAGIGKAKATQ